MGFIFNIFVLYGLSKLVSGPMGAFKAAIGYAVLSVIFLFVARGFVVDPEPIVMADLALYTAIVLPVSFVFFYLLYLTEDTILAWLIVFVAGVFLIP